MKKFEMELLNSEKSQMILGCTCTAQVTDDPCKLVLIDQCDSLVTPTCPNMLMICQPRNVGQCDGVVTGGCDSVITVIPPRKP